MTYSLLLETIALDLQWGHFNSVCMRVCGHTTGKSTHLQTKAGPSISKNRPIPKLCTIKHEPKAAKLQYVLLNLQENHPLPASIIEMATSSDVLRIKIMAHPYVFMRKFTHITISMGLSWRVNDGIPTSFRFGAFMVGARQITRPMEAWQTDEETDPPSLFLRAR